MNIIGHEKIINFLDKSIEKDKISHAYLFTGSAHLGKFSVAMDFAEKITRPHRYASDLTSEALRAGWPEENSNIINPDIIVVKPEVSEKDGEKKEKEIKIKQIRDLEHELSLSAYFEKYKVAIIDDADRLTIPAQNSLLKTLEEPQKKCVLILVCHNAQKLLPTIKSRCLIKKFSLVSDTEISNLVTDEKNKKEIIFWSQGLPGVAFNLQAKKGELEKRECARKDLEKILDANVSEKFEFCDKLSKNQKEAVEVLGFWVMLFRNELLGKNNFLKIRPEKSLEVVQEIQKSIELIRETNSNLKSVLENLILKF